jgi:Ca-activated chloride channel family protein
MWSEQAKPSGGSSPAAPSVWARGRLRDLEDRYAIDRGDALEKEIVATSLRFGVLCRFTAFVAVDRSEVVNPGGQVHGIVQPVEQPQGWEMNQPLRYAARKARGAVHMFRLSQSQMPETNSGEIHSAFCMRESECRAAETPPATPPLYPQGLRSRVMDLIRQLRMTGQKAAARRGRLQAMVEDIEEIYSTMLGAGVRPPEVLELAEVIAKIRALLAGPVAGAAEVNELWSRTKTALKNSLTHLAGPEPSPRGEFWK